MTTKRSLNDRLAAEGVLCAQGYLFELERRGFLAAGIFVPEVVLDHPEELYSVHKAFQHAGSDVVQAFTYYAHREKLKVLGKEDLLEPMNRQAIRLAHRVARDVAPDAEPNLVAGNICNTNIWDPSDKAAQKEVRAIFEEQVRWAVEEEADYVIAETFYHAGEALMALEVLNQFAMPSVVTLAISQKEGTLDGKGYADTCKELEQAGALAVGYNCFNGPHTMLPYLHELRGAVSGHIAALPVPYRTTCEHQTFFNLPDPGAHVPYPPRQALPHST